MKKTTKIPIEILNLDGKGCHIYIDAYFNNLKGFLIIDTGASQTVLDTEMTKNNITKIDYKEFSDRNDCIPLNEKFTKSELDEFGVKDDEMLSMGVGAGNINFEFGTFKSFKIGDLSIKNMNVALLDLGHVNKLYDRIAGIKIWGLLGSDFLNEYRALINYDKMTLTLSY